MSFVENLRARKVFNPVAQPRSTDNGVGDVLSSVRPFINGMRNSAKQDFMEVENFRNPDRLRQSFKPMPGAPGDPNMAPAPSIIPPWIQPRQSMMPQNAIYQPPLNEREGALTAKDKIDFGLKKRALDQNERIGDEKLAIGRDAQDLKEIKNQQIYSTTIAKMEQASHLAESKMALLETQLRGNQNNMQLRAMLDQAKMEATAAANRLDAARKDAQFEDARKSNELERDLMRQDLAEHGLTTEETQITDADGKVTQGRRRIIQKGKPGSTTGKPNDPAGIRR